MLVIASPALGRGWRPLGEGLPDAGQWRQGFDLADLDGDGYLDLVHGPPRRGEGRAVVYRGDGRGGFALWRDARFPEQELDYGAALAADFSGDGRADLAFGVHLGGLTVWRNEGAGVFSRWDEGLELEIGGSAFSSRALAVIDWDGDGRLDLAALGEGPSPGSGARSGSFGLRIHLNRGDGSWRHVAAEDPGRLFGYSLAAGDLEGDGTLEVVTSSRSQGRSRVVHFAAAGGSMDRRTLPELREGAVLHAVEMLDADGDGVAEVAVSFLARDPAGNWVAGIDLHDARRGRKEVLRLAEGIEISTLAAGDLDADGTVDLVAAGVSGRVWVFAGKGDGSFRRIGAASVERAAGGCKASHARLVDLDGEPGDELVLSFSNEPTDDVCSTGGSIQAWRFAGGRRAPRRRGR